jgi:hypothetical protein
MLNEKNVETLFQRCILQSDNPKDCTLSGYPIAPKLVKNFGGGYFAMSLERLDTCKEEIASLYKQVKGIELWEDVNYTKTGEKWTEQDEYVDKFLALCIGSGLIDFTS